MSTDHVDPSRLHGAGIGLSPRTQWARNFSRFFGAKVATDIYSAAEFVSVFVVGLVIAEIYVRGHLGVADYYGQYIVPLLLVPAAMTLILRNRQLADFTKLSRFSASIGRVLLYVLLAFVAVIVIGFAAGVANDYSRVWYVSWFVASSATVLTLRAAASRVFLRMAASGYIQKTVVLYGDSELAKDVISEIAETGHGIQVAGVYGPPPALMSGLNPQYLGDLPDLVAFGQSHRVDTIIVTARTMQPEDLEKLLVTLSVLPAEVQLYLGIANGHMPIRSLSALNHLRLLDVQRKPISDWGYLVKTVEDYTVALAGLVLTAPILIAAAIAIKLDSKGPVFFRQRRHGFNHEVINVFKFRTMSVMEDGDEVRQAVRGDPRVTRVGGFLRKTSIDELPQLFNVLSGDMSIVGPRPHPLALNSHYAGVLARYETRHRVKPGITGWAQINGFRGPTEDPELMRKRIEYDLEYIENWSLWMDLKIIAATPFLGIFHKNAL